MLQHAQQQTSPIPPKMPQKIKLPRNNNNFNEYSNNNKENIMPPSNHNNKDGNLSSITRGQFS